MINSTLSAGSDKHMSGSILEDRLVNFVSTTCINLSKNSDLPRRMKKSELYLEPLEMTEHKTFKSQYQTIGEGELLYLRQR